MKAYRLSDILPIMIYCMYLCSCSPADRTQDIQFNRIEKEMNVPLTSEKEAPVCTINIIIDEAESDTVKAEKINEAIKAALFGDHNHLTLKAAIDSFCHQCISSYREMAGLYEADRKQHIQSTWYDYRYNITSDYKQGAHDCLCYRITDIRYEGGINEVRQIHLLNFNQKTGEKIELKDILLPTYPIVLHPLLQKALLKKFDCNDINDLHDKGLLLLTDVYIPENYELNSNGIVFLYNADEIAPYDTGAITIQIPYGELKPIIKKEYQYLWN